jgi:uncharacterized SAM-binding protein YcdF (DUF218 family)
MHYLVNFLVLPITIFWLVLLTGIIFYLFKYKRTGLIFGSLSILWLTLISFPFLPSILVRSLEDRFPQLMEISQIPKGKTIVILVLGGGRAVDKNLSPKGKLTIDSLSRLSEGIRLHRILPGSHLVFSDASRGQKYSLLAILKQTALAMGVEEKEISLLPASDNTQMEAFNFTNKFGIDNTLILVTDAIHMPRAMLLFRRAGQSPIPAPTNYIMKSEGKKYLKDYRPSTLNISKMEKAMHEIGGLVYARLFYRGVVNVKNEKK